MRRVSQQVLYVPDSGKRGWDSMHVSSSSEGAGTSDTSRQNTRKSNNDRGSKHRDPSPHKSGLHWKHYQ